MIERLSGALGRVGTRPRLAAAIAVIVLAALAGTYVAVYRGTGSDLRGQVDRDLSEDAGNLARHVRSSAAASAADIARQAQRYIDSQPTFGPSAGLLLVKVDGARPATNEPELVGAGREAGESAGEQAAEATQARQILSAPVGFSTVDVADVGAVRLLSRPLLTESRGTARITVGEPLHSVQVAQSGVSRTFLIAGSIALVAALIAGSVVAARATSPIRRMSRVAGAVDAGDLSTRMAPEGPIEARRLAESFNRMLDRLEEAFRRQRAFVSDASHELRTPLTAIRGQIEVLARADRVSPDEVAATAAVVTGEVERMERMVEEMLLLAQMDEGLAGHTAPTDVPALVSDAAAGLSAGLDRELEISPPPPGTVIADRDQIIQVIRNLIRNAVEHTSPGGSIRVGSEARDGTLRIAVSDDGPGIPASERDRIFVRFHRVEPSRSRGSGGAGLGLAIARAIVEAHRGRIWADEAPGGGARIALELPGYRPDRA